MRYSVLGVAQVWDGGGAPVPLAGGRLRSLVTVLALHAGRAVPQDALIAEVWADSPPADAAGALQALVARLRKAVGRDAVASEPGGGYRLVAERDAVDLHVFEALLHDGEAALDRGDPGAARTTLSRALALWRGPALADLPDRAAAAARPEALRLAAMRARAEADLALGRAADALPLLREAVADHPLDEAFRAQLIRALRAAGRTADALMAYEDTRTVLAETLGADPGPELRALHAALLRQDPDPGPGPRSDLRSDPGPAPSPDPGPSAAPVGVPAPATGGGAGARAGADLGVDADRGPYGKTAAGQAPAAVRGNLRARLTSFVGRESDLEDLRADLAAHRLVTLTGSGGSGKTRLAQEAAERTRPEDYPDGVWLAELAPLDDPTAIPHAVLNALGRRDTVVLTSPGYTADDPLDRLFEHCAQRRLLLVLDNCEHVVDEAALVTDALLAECPGVTVLATSREPLGVPGEVVRPVEPLPPLPAYRLFAERAAAVPGGGARLAERDEEAVHEICRRLDGLPLAIELAAARLRALSPRQIADRLDDRFRLLTGGSRTLLPRQQTLRAVVDWSWELLDEPERAALCALSVFSGGCTLPAAEAVCGPDALDAVAQLVDKSLVLVEHGHPGGTRYRLLETIHEYAAERLAEHPERAAAAGARHTAYHRELARTVDAGLRGADQMRLLDVMETEMDNMRAAINRALAARAEADAAALVLSMGWFCWLRNYRDEGGSWLTRVIALGGPPAEDPADPMYWSRLDLRLLDFLVKSDGAAERDWFSEEAMHTAELLSRAYREGGPAAARFPGLLWPFTLYLIGEDAHGCSDMVVANCRAYGGDWEVAAALMFRAHTAVDTPGQLTSVDADLAELRELCAHLGDRWIRAQLHSASGEAETLRCHYEQARADFEAAVALTRELGAYGEGAFLVGRLAELAHRSGDDETAAKLCAQAEEEAERYAVMDAVTYLRYLKSLLLLRGGDTAGARALHASAEGHLAEGTPPPVFPVLMRSLGARITAAEGDPLGALAGFAEAARAAQEAHCTDPVLAAQLDAAAELLLPLGAAADAVRLAAAADAVRGALPRTVPEEAAHQELRRAADAVLAPRELAAARAAAAGTDRVGAVRLLTRAVARVQVA